MKKIILLSVGVIFIILVVIVSLNLRKSISLNSKAAGYVKDCKIWECGGVCASDEMCVARTGGPTNRKCVKEKTCGKNKKGSWTAAKWRSINNNTGWQKVQETGYIYKSLKECCSAIGSCDNNSTGPAMYDGQVLYHWTCFK